MSDNRKTINFEVTSFYYTGFGSIEGLQAYLNDAVRFGAKNMKIFEIDGSIKFCMLGKRLETDKEYKERLLYELRNAERELSSIENASSLLSKIEKLKSELESLNQ